MGPLRDAVQQTHGHACPGEADACMAFHGMLTLVVDCVQLLACAGVPLGALRGAEQQAQRHARPEEAAL